ncbi:MAG TPA: penicillin-binding transpeptidase domain-containing protein [Patescibacteria group bacterium]|nr:penicillin-binding transpeptidase domain-containing protein [Patescibacteria group bacterium]
MTYSRTYWVGIIMLVATVIALFRVTELQLFRGKELRAKADENRFFTRYLPAPRGVFRDRNGRVLVYNAPLYKKASFGTESSPYPTLEEITEEEAIQLLAHDEKNVFIDQKRTYSYGQALSHVLGYVGETTRDELRANPNYYIGESVGRLGLEKAYQEQLSGRFGKEVFEMHATGKLLRSIHREEPVAGTDIGLTIDASFSAVAYQTLNGRRGAVVASDPETGEVLALVSSPGFDTTAMGDALKDERLPILFRAVNGTYPPGSTFKIITAAAGLQQNAITQDTLIKDEGVLRVGTYSYGNWYYSQYGRVEGDVNVVKAIQRSNDIFFYKVAELVGPESLAAMARRFHLGSKTGIDMPQESSGVIPDPEWKRRTQGEDWFLGNTYHMGIGQGDILITPLQINQMTAAVARGGVWCKPFLRENSTPRCEELNLTGDTLRLIHEGMKAVCATGGTAFPFFDKKPVEVACKTGTAEFGPADASGKRKTHGWMTLFAPADKPTIALTVLVEGTEEQKFIEGSRDAGPIAKTLIEWWFAHTTGR